MPCKVHYLCPDITVLDTVAFPPSLSSEGNQVMGIHSESQLMGSVGGELCSDQGLANHSWLRDGHRMWVVRRRRAESCDEENGLVA